jgi:hypothetical protein
MLPSSAKLWPCKGEVESTPPLLYTVGILLHPLERDEHPYPLMKNELEWSLRCRPE